MMKFIKKIIEFAYYLMGLALVQVALICVSIYLFMVLLPNYIGCILPDKMCMIGTDKFYEVLVILATLMPSLLVAYGYKIWRGQKAKELLATKAQEIYFELDRVVMVLDEHKELMKSSPETITRNSSAYIDVKKACDDISKSLLLFKELLTEEKSPHSINVKRFYTRITHFEDIARELQKLSSYGGKLDTAIDEFAMMQEIILLTNLNQDIDILKDNLIKIILHK